MSIAGIRSVQGGISVKKSSHDSYETNIKKQIQTLEEKLEAISNDEEKPAEQKAKEKQAAQEQLQNLNQELKEYQIRKQQEEAEKRKEAIKDSAESPESADTPVQEENTTGLDSSQTGVMITLSSTQQQLAGMVRVRKSLEGKQRTAYSEEEKADLQKKINNLSKGIGQKMTNAKRTITEYQKTTQKEDSVKKPKPESRKKEEVFWTDTKQSRTDKTTSADKPLLSGKNKPFDNISYSIK